MHYFKVFASNGICGCDEEWLVETEKEDLDFYEDILCYYTYECGYAGMEYDEDDWAEYDEEDNDPYVGYENAICENSSWEEISKEEFEMLRDEEDWTVIM